MTSPDRSTYCRTCRRALHSRTSPGGIVEHLHPEQLRGEASDHRPEPVPFAELTDAVQVCDFCSATPVRWAYVCANQTTDIRRVATRYVSLSGYRRRHDAARSIRDVTAVASTQNWGERWASCDDCAALLEAGDLNRLVTRVTEGLPNKVTRGKRLARIRGQLHAVYSHVIATRVPGRGRITADHPLGIWEDSPTDDDPDRPPAAGNGG